MNTTPKQLWHKESYERFLNQSLPELLAERMLLTSYRVEKKNARECRVQLVVGGSGGGTVEIKYNIPLPDEDGIFLIKNSPRTVVPIANGDQFEQAEVSCVGEQLYEFVNERLGSAPQNLAWDESLVRSWLPLADWINEFMSTQAQLLDSTNWLSRHEHSRSIIVENRQQLFSASERGRICPIQTPEGPNIGRVLRLARGAAIRDRKIIIEDDSPPANLSLCASMIPFAEYSDGPRLLIGANMRRQCVLPDVPEPALVQTGFEPNAKGFWCGRNLLTAFISRGIDTFEDAIVISESAALRMGFSGPLECGDKLSNRHGTRGVISRIIPDAELPYMADGTPVELIYSFIGQHTRLNFGFIMEALMGRIAKAEGEPAIVPPFNAPSLSEIRDRLKKAKLPESGMETLTDGKRGNSLDGPSTVGWVYWGKTWHLARRKLMLWTDKGKLQFMGMLEANLMKKIGAREIFAECFKTLSADRLSAQELSGQVAAGPIQPAGAASPAFTNLVNRLEKAGITARLQNERVSFSLESPEEPNLKLAAAVAHPWLRNFQIAYLGSCEELQQYQSLVQTNEKLGRMISDAAPEGLIAQAQKKLGECVHNYLQALLPNKILDLNNGIYFSGRTVSAPASDFKIDQIGLPEELVWSLYSPLLTRELGSKKDVENRSQRALKKLDEILADSWIMVYRPPSIMPTSILAFHPVRQPEKVIRLHPLCCRLIHADFDGDQLAVFLPITEAGQQEAGQIFSVAGHLTRDRQLIKLLTPYHESLFGLAKLSLTEQGRRQIGYIIGIVPDCPDGYLTEVALVELFDSVLERDGVPKTLAKLEELTGLGFRVAQQSGASINPFIGDTKQFLSSKSDDDCPEACDAIAEENGDRLAACKDFDNPQFGVQLLTVKSGARGNIWQLRDLMGPQGSVTDADGTTVPVWQGFARGLAANELLASLAGMREEIAQHCIRVESHTAQIRETNQPAGFGVIVRAMRSKQPGAVFARAAANGEVDFLTDSDARLFVGLGI